jgi:hypothetical protein
VPGTERATTLFVSSSVHDELVFPMMRIWLSSFPQLPEMLLDFQQAALAHAITRLAHGEDGAEQQAQIRKPSDINCSLNKNVPNVYVTSLGVKKDKTDSS